MNSALPFGLLLPGLCPVASQDGGIDPDASRPALVVVVGVDQLARWVFDAAWPHLSSARGGFHALTEGGVRFTDCAYRHACTETGPGHATISTGVVAAVHGIVGNRWWDHRLGRLVYCAEAAGARTVPRGGVGTGPGLLLVPTLGDRIKERFGETAQVVSMSFKDRAAILMAGARGDLVTWPDLKTGRFVSSSVYCESLPAWLDRFNGRQPFAARFGRVWSRIGPPAAYAGLVDARAFEGPDYHGRRTLPAVVDGKLTAPGPAFYRNVYYSPYANDILVDLASAAIDGHKLGRDDVPDLLCLGFTATDTIGHKNGPNSVEMRDALLRLDRKLAELLRVLDAKVGRGRYTLVLTADHGVGPVPESRVAKGEPAGRNARLPFLIRAAAERALRAEYGAPPAGTERWIAHIDGPALHFARTAFAERAIDMAEAGDHVAKAVVGLGGVARVFVTARVRAGRDDGGDDMDALVRNSVHPDRSGDVLVLLEPHWLMHPTPASHGSPYPYDREVPLFAYGHGIRRGHAVGAPVSPGVVPVLLGHLLGIEPPEAAADPVPREALVR